MSEAKHTPGPWEAAHLDEHGQRVVRGENIEIATCWHHSVRSIEIEMEANARLIAAAPDLLEALEAAQSALDSGCYTILHNGPNEQMETYARMIAADEKARAALAKARGEP